ncbi:hypothetical protein C943_01498 [Mariniradius saccharolyticus AK6]|uniref:Uncharacterized protein n=1 Tax=Mariniradius saccharolyticus AK6 TaxID=1239962 RepID=M7Y4Q5_9BACT|nr:hypothetical protein C943_01498 [Mariniradius saccharolyticus AK6]
MFRGFFVFQLPTLLKSMTYGGQFPPVVDSLHAVQKMPYFSSHKLFLS